VEKQLLIPPSWCASSCIATDSRLFGQHRHICASSATHSPDLAPAGFFLISQSENDFERITVSDDSRDYGKFADRGTHDPEKGIPGLFLEVVTA
jgi:hypothetical protein